MKTTAFPVSRLHFPSWSGLTVRVPDFIALMKPRVMVLAVFTTAVGLFIAPGDLDPLLGAVSIIAIAAGAGAAGALGILIVILVAAGSIWIMTNLNENMMPPPELMNLHMQH